MLKYRPEIDGLRALAVVAVILFHAAVPGFGGGFIGVDIFFVISGYLITGIITKELILGHFSLAQFYERRIRRILPALFFVMLCCLVPACCLLLPSQWDEFYKSVIAVPLFVSNVLFWLSSGYFSTASEQKPLLHTWSLGVEEQFYIVFPLLLWLFWRFGRKNIVTLLWILFAASFSLAQWGGNLSAHAPFIDQDLHWTNIPNGAFFLAPMRAWELLLGALVCLHPVKQYKKSYEWLAWIGLAGIVAPVFVYSKATPFPGFYALLPAMSTGFVLSCASAETRVARVLSHRFAVAIGLISYSAYLWHQPLLSFARIYMMEALSYPAAALLIVATFVLAYISWRYIEQPFRNKNFGSRRQIFAFAFLGSVLFVLCGFAGLQTNGFHFKKLSQTEQSLITPVKSNAEQQENTCFLLDKAVQADAFAKNSCAAVSKARNILLIGDSHAASLYPALKPYLASQRINLQQMTAAYCVPLAVKFPKNESFVADKRCADINKKILQTIESKKFDTIILSAFLYEWGFSKDPQWSYADYMNDFLPEIGKIARSGQKIILIGQFPVWKKSLPDLLAKEVYAGQGQIEDISAYGINEKAIASDKTLHDMLEQQGVKYISLVDQLCDGNACRRLVPWKNGRTPIAVDYGHLSKPGADYIVKNIVGPAFE